MKVELFPFQKRAVSDLRMYAAIALNTYRSFKIPQVISLQAPTGSGKTIILIDFIEEYLTKINSRTAFIWLCPGKGDLEEQSRQKMRKFAPHRYTQNLFDALQNGFDAESTTFINWELVTKKGNTAIRDSERKNLFDRIAEAHRAGTEFIVIIDEEHSNNPAKAKNIKAPAGVTSVPGMYQDVNSIQILSNRHFRTRTASSVITAPPSCKR